MVPCPHPISGSLTDWEGSALEATAVMAFGPGGSWFSSCIKKPTVLHRDAQSSCIQREVLYRYSIERYPVHIIIHYIIYISHYIKHLELHKF